MKRSLIAKLMTPNFIDNKGQRRLLPKDKDVFFFEFIPRSMQLRSEWNVEELDDDNLIFTDDSVLYKKSDNRMAVINFQDINGCRFYYNTREYDLKWAFVGNDRELHFTNIERKLFFDEYIPRVFGSPSKTGTIEMVEI